MKDTTQFLSSSPFFFQLLISVFFLGEFAMSQNATIAINIGVVLDFDRSVSKMGLSCISLALSDFYATHEYYRTRLVLHTRDSKEDVVGAASAALDLMKNVQVQAIIGPLTSAQANFIANLGDKAQVPIVSFTATSPFLSIARTPYFIRATQNDSSQVQAISSIVQNYGWREAVPIYEDTDYGNGIIPYLTDALQEVDARIPYRSVIPDLATDDQILEELYKLMTMQTRVFIVHMLPSLGSRLLLKAKEVGMMSEGYVWILTNGLANLLDSLDSSIIDSMQGALGIRTYVPKSKEIENFTVRWRRRFQQENPYIQRPELDVFGLWAYDVVWALAMAAEKVGGMTLRFQNLNGTQNSTDLEAIGVSHIGPQLLQAISRTDFKGLSGNFSFIDGQLQSSVYKIVNVIGNGRKMIGFWTPTSGITRDLNVSSGNKYTTSKLDLRTILWPGDTSVAPKGWVIPTSGKKLRIGVPVKNGFSEFVNVKRDPKTNATKVEGFCIDVFKAVIEALPYAVSYEFVPFEKANGESAGSYDDLIDQVYFKNYDAVVGDVTIISNRSSYVDFTLPYTESGVSLIVSIKENKNKNAWIFLEPLTADLWVTSASFFIFIGCVIWVLEHRINEDFRGPPSYQLGTIFWFSFSTLVFAHRERVVSNLARFVVIIWVFVVLILTSSYTASLTSMLTVQKLQPTITNIQELLKNNGNVGYQEGSFVPGLLKRMKFDDSRLKVYGSPEEFDELFSKGSQNGGIVAAFDEIPYINLLLARYCDKYTMVAPTYKTDGFGFVFPRGSPLVSDISRAVLNVTEGEKMGEIEKAYFENETSCSDSSTKLSSNSLTLGSFWGLFLIAGVASFFALLVYSAIFIYEHRNILKRSETSIWKRIVTMAKRFNEKDLSSHTFRKTDYRDRDIALQDMRVDASSHTNTLPSPSTVSFTSFEEQRMSDYSNPIQETLTSQGRVPRIELQMINIQERVGSHGIDDESK